MKLRQGIVVATHPEDYSVDLVMLDDGSRVVGAQILTPNGSARTGMFNMAPVTREGSDKWDITQRTDQDQYAVVGFINSNPVVVGFLYPQINQINRKSDRTLFFRHHSDLTVKVNEFGEMTVSHPGGFSLKVGTPTAPQGQDDGPSDDVEINRNLETYPNFSITLRGDDPAKPGVAFSLSLGPNGELSISSRENVSISTAKEIRATAKNMIMSADKIRMETPLVEVTGDVVAGGVSLRGHIHSGVKAGADNSGIPVGGSRAQAPGGGGGTGGGSGGTGGGGGGGSGGGDTFVPTYDPWGNLVQTDGGGLYYIQSQRLVPTNISGTEFTAIVPEGDRIYTDANGNVLPYVTISGSNSFYFDSGGVLRTREDTIITQTVPVGDPLPLNGNKAPPSS